MFEKLKKLFILSYIIGNKKKENFPAKRKNVQSPPVDYTGCQRFFLRSFRRQSCFYGDPREKLFLAASVLYSVQLLPWVPEVFLAHGGRK